MTSILIVEDDAEVLMLLKHILLDADYQVHSAQTARQAMMMIDNVQYDLVIADGKLTDGTGMMVAEHAQQAGAKALIITGYAFELPKEQLGRYDFLLKPVRPDELLGAVEEKLQAART